MAKGGISRLKRKERFRSPRKLYLIITEGETEKNYFSMIKKHKTSNVKITCTKGKHPAVIHLIATADRYLEVNKADELTQCWIILDTDVLTASDLNMLKIWQAGENKISIQKVAISSPMFEYWLLLHYKLPAAQLDKTQCENELKAEDSKYKKPFTDCHHLWQRVPEALERSRGKEISLNNHSDNGTNIHKLVKQLV